MKEREREGWREGGNKTASKQGRKGKKQKSTFPLVLCHQIERTDLVLHMEKFPLIKGNS